MLEFNELISRACQSNKFNPRRITKQHARRSSRSCSLGVNVASCPVPRRNYNCRSIWQASVAWEPRGAEIYKRISRSPVSYAYRHLHLRPILLRFPRRTRARNSFSRPPPPPPPPRSSSPGFIAACIAVNLSPGFQPRH